MGVSAKRAVRLTKEPGKSVASVARNLGISPYTLCERRRKLEPEGEPSANSEETFEQQNRRLRRELEQRRDEAAILITAIAHFVERPTK